MPFRDVIGHGRLIDLLARSVQHNSLPPSLVFSGPSGIGKRLVATAVAQALNCQEPRELKTSADRPGIPGIAGIPGIPGINDACGRCSACTRIARGIHPDALVVVPGDNGSIKVDQVRDVIDRCAYRPFEGKRRAVIVDDAETLVAAAQNALLKTLEEPPSGSVFMLITARPDMLLPTVRSRCPQLRFRLLSTDDIVRALMARRMSETEARVVAAAADGSLGRALDASAGDLVEARQVAERVLLHAAASNEPRRRMEAAKDLLANTGAGGATDREQLASHLRAMSALIRDVEMVSAGADGMGLANADVRPTLDRLAPAYGGDRGMRAFEAVDRALVALERNAGVKIVADWIVLQL